MSERRTTSPGTATHVEPRPTSVERSGSDHVRVTCDVDGERVYVADRNRSLKPWTTDARVARVFTRRHAQALIDRGIWADHAPDIETVNDLTAESPSGRARGAFDG